MWAPDGSELFYRDQDETVMGVSVDIDPTFTAGSPRVVVQQPYWSGGGVFYGRTYDVSRDGQRFLMVKSVSDPANASADELVVVLNWFEELKARVPTN